VFAARGWSAHVPETLADEVQKNYHHSSYCFLENLAYFVEMMACSQQPIVLI